MQFSSIIGQEHAVRWLRRLVREQAVPQSLLFLGPIGCGKVSTALALAAATNCREPADGESCGVCVECRRLAADEHPDIIRIAPDGETTKIWQLWTRQGHPPGALETLPFAPVAAPVRHYLIERAETLNDESANSLLKALEEPPPYVRFILCAPSRDAVLPTILSRCQVVPFQSVPVDTIARALEQQHAVETSTALSIARLSDGAPGKALRSLGSADPTLERERILDIADRLSRSPAVAAFRLAEELRGGTGKRSKSDGDGDEPLSRGDTGRSVEVLASWFIDLLRVAVRGPETPLLNPGAKDRVVAAATRYTPDGLVRRIESCFRFRDYLSRNANAALATEVLLMGLVPGDD